MDTFLPWVPAILSAVFAAGGIVASVKIIGGMLKERLLELKNEVKESTTKLEGKLDRQMEKLSSLEGRIIVLEVWRVEREKHSIGKS